MSAGVVAALNAEARTWGVAALRGQGICTAWDGTLVTVSGMGGAAAAAAAHRLADAGAAALVSWGLAGGLDPKLPAGTLCLPATVLCADGRCFTTDRHWRERVNAAMPVRQMISSGVLLTSPVTIDELGSKAAAFHATGAVAVDMESAAVAGVAALRRLPFIGVRVIVDTALDLLPGAVRAATHDGEVKLAALLQSLIGSPRDIAALLRLSFRYRTAMRVLTAVARSGALAPLEYTSIAAKRMT